MTWIDSENKRRLIADYNEALSNCSKILNDVDQKWGTYGVIEVDDIETTRLSSTLRTYTRSVIWQRILVQ